MRVQECLSSDTCAVRVKEDSCLPGCVTDSVSRSSPRSLQVTDRDLPFGFLPRVAPDALIVVCLPALEPGRIHYSPAISPSRCNVSSTFSILSPTHPSIPLMPPYKRDQIYNWRPFGICPNPKKRNIQGLFTCLVAMKRFEESPGPC